MVRFSDIRNDEAIREYIKSADSSLLALGFTEHSFAHVGKVAADAEMILQTLGYPEREIELVKIAAYRLRMILSSVPTVVLK